MADSIYFCCVALSRCLGGVGGGEVGDYHDDDEVAHISCNMCNNYALADSTLMFVERGKAELKCHWRSPTESSVLFYSIGGCRYEDERETPERTTVGHPRPEIFRLESFSQVSFRLLHLFNKHKAKKRSTLHSRGQINKLLGNPFGSYF